MLQLHMITPCAYFVRCNKDNFIAFMQHYFYSMVTVCGSEGHVLAQAQIFYILNFFVLEIRYFCILQYLLVKKKKRYCSSVNIVTISSPV